MSEILRQLWGKQFRVSCILKSDDTYTHSAMQDLPDNVKAHIESVQLELLDWLTVQLEHVRKK